MRWKMGIAVSHEYSIQVPVQVKDKLRVFILGLILFTITKKEKTSVSRIIDTIIRIPLKVAFSLMTSSNYLNTSLN
ncbi:hypothetical protein EYC80_009148 [Monilinia laxa]|uniref:Uncharacterized protein n=1 Tax=Monilinia laxa TaxID=61186 RepID=A0A5N6K2Y0_MONLA|nr:hypothetical protein EYC80_009148 [Monilinia laxa]